jgi:hypothetical protein
MTRPGRPFLALQNHNALEAPPLRRCTTGYRLNLAQDRSCEPIVCTSSPLTNQPEWPGGILPLLCAPLWRCLHGMKRPSGWAGRRPFVLTKSTNRSINHCWSDAGVGKVAFPPPHGSDTGHEQVGKLRLRKALLNALLISSGTERALIEVASKSLLGKALARPQHGDMQRLSSLSSRLRSRDGS